MSECNLPRLLYWADLPVSPSSAGAIAMYRLLEGWPEEKLMIVTPGAVDGCPLPGVMKSQPPTAPFEFLFHSRLAREWMTFLTLQGMAKRWLAGGRAPRWMSSTVAKFAPEAILTVGIAGAWMGADALARRLEIPLHVIVHDDHHYAFFWVNALKPWGERLFGATYRRAVSRLCVSEPMEREYQKRYGVAGDVLLPARSRNSVFFREPRRGLLERLSTANVFYAGSVYGENFIKMDQIGAALAARGHILRVYTLSPPPPNFRPQYMELRPPQPSVSELVKQLHEEADVLLMLSDFSHRDSLRTLFPSKMVDYTAAAVPILVVAPEDACIAYYLKRRPLAGQLLSDDSPEAIADAVDALAMEPQTRQRLAQGAATAGGKDFSYERAFEIFRSALSRQAVR
jgi:glycosyltransferase involved in cell wall biosynthesis